MSHIAPFEWPPTERISFCYLARGKSLESGYSYSENLFHVNFQVEMEKNRVMLKRVIPSDHFGIHILLILLIQSFMALFTTMFITIISLKNGKRSIPQKNGKFQLSQVLLRLFLFRKKIEYFINIQNGAMTYLQKLKVSSRKFFLRVLSLEFILGMVLTGLELVNTSKTVQICLQPLNAWVISTRKEKLLRICVFQPKKLLSDN